MFNNNNKIAQSNFGTGCIATVLLYVRRDLMALILNVLHRQANGEMELSSALTRNFSVDSRHLVLLHGYQLTGM